MIESPILDLALAFGLLVTAYRALHTRALFTAVVFYIAFGMLMSIVWIRLRAPDLALAEAALGTGVMGAILLDAARAMEGGADPGAPEPRSRIGGTVAALACTAFAVILSVTLLGLGPGRFEGMRFGVIPEITAGGDPRPAGGGADREADVDRAAATPAESGEATGAGSATAEQASAASPTDLAGLVAINLPASGVTYPVTAVLLNFRGYDTLLEVTVLLLAVLGSLVVFRGARVPSTTESVETVRVPGEISPVATGAARLLAPWGVLVGGYLLWLGSGAPGGAFQAGAVVGAAGVLLILAGEARQLSFESHWTRAALAVGTIVFLAVAIVSLVVTGTFLHYPSGRAGLAIVMIEGAVAIGVAASLVVLYAGGRMTRSGSGTRQ